MIQTEKNKSKSESQKLRNRNNCSIYTIEKHNKSMHNVRIEAYNI